MRSLSAVDSIDAPTTFNHSWADHHIDVGTGSTTVGLHHSRNQDMPSASSIRTDGPTPSNDSPIS